MMVWWFILKVCILKLIAVCYEFFFFHLLDRSKMVKVTMYLLLDVSGKIKQWKSKIICDAATGFINTISTYYFIWNILNYIKLKKENKINAHDYNYRLHIQIWWFRYICMYVQCTYILKYYYPWCYTYKLFHERWSKNFWKLILKQ